MFLTLRNLNDKINCTNFEFDLYKYLSTKDLVYYVFTNEELCFDKKCY